jgi:hypothetical protein
VGKHNLSAILATAALLSGSVLLHVPNAHAEGDWPYSGSSSQDFDNDYRTYKRNDGYSTNFVNELVPLSTFGNDGRLKFESRDVEQRGSQATRFDNSNTGLQLDFNF